jgi:hypothetical protein
LPRDEARTRTGAGPGRVRFPFRKDCATTPAGTTQVNIVT